MDEDNINRFETRAQRRSERVSRVANLNTEAPFGEVNWEDNHEWYNEMITDAFGMGMGEDLGAISDTIELMLNEPWINYSEILEDIKRRWFDKWAEGLRGPRKRRRKLGSPTTTRLRGVTSRSCGISEKVSYSG
ncbi:hypothetical protein PIB30_018107 [Stylosanthes scabra]|uniref:Uncharacterized protein n=1 Tax=Stylosanthes scabra TaxID=79078 RepID=A0ABU6Z586_9FABA|nr:hypothetical protein [Stylosanthes scabra]